MPKANRIDEPVELRMSGAVALVRDWTALPEKERNDFARAIAARAAWWRKSDTQRATDERARYLRFIAAATISNKADDDEADDDEDWPAT
jgi:hypothetical protein